MTKEIIDVDCPHAKSDMTPCVARDGEICTTTDNRCVGCGNNVSEMFRELVKKYIALKDKVANDKTHPA